SAGGRKPPSKSRQSPRKHWQNARFEHESTETPQKTPSHAHRSREFQRVPRNAGREAGSAATAITQPTRTRAKASGRSCVMNVTGKMALPNAANVRSLEAGWHSTQRRA